MLPFILLVVAGFLASLRDLPEKISYALILAFLGQACLVLSSELFGVAVFPLLPDEINYHTYAVRILESGRAPPGESGAQLYAHFLALMYRVTGPSMAAGRILNIALSLSALGVMYRLVRRFDAYDTAATLLVGFMILLPTRIFYHSALLREAPVFSLLVSGIFFLSIALGRSPLRKLLYLGLAGLSLYGVYLFRGENLYVFGVALLLVPVVSPRSLFSDRLAGVFVALGIVGVVASLQTVSPGQLLTDLNQFAGAARPRADLYDLGLEYGSLTDAIRAAPYRAMLYAIAPDPFTVSHYRYLLPTATSAFILAYFGACLGTGIVAGRSRFARDAISAWREYRITVVVLAVTFVVALVLYSLAERNFLAAPRHRLQFTWMLYALFALFALQGRRLTLSGGAIRITTLTSRRTKPGFPPGDSS